MNKYKVPIQSLIDHIKTSMDVDPWAKEMAEDLLKEQQHDLRVMFNRCDSLEMHTGRQTCGICGLREKCRNRGASHE